VGHPAPSPCPTTRPPDASSTVAAFSAPRILAVETSCDETAAAIIDGEGRLLSDIVASQVDFHARFGGVVPEIASRKHTEAIVGVVDATLDEAGLCSWQELDALAVTYAPGLIGALVVGVAFAKGLSWATGLPLIRVNHLEGHIYANRMGFEDLARQSPDQTNEAAGAPLKQKNEAVSASLSQDTLSPPFVIALLSGGHTMLVQVSDWGEYRILGRTLDDAVGEAFDKIAKALGLGYPGGPVISRLAEQGNPRAFDFPRALLHSHDYRFSLSGLKTAVITFIKREREAGGELDLPDIAASFQQAVIDVQVAKALAALEETKCATFCIGGGVAANKALRAAYEKAMTARGIRVVFPPRNACTDNAAMIARVALDRFRNGNFMGLDDDAFAQTDLELRY
jgi:N6-L-threonylcarbamoyladenine synthase